MTTGQAADVLSSLPNFEAQEILKRLNPDNTEKIRAIMDEQEQDILNFATEDFLSFPPGYTVKQARDGYRKAGKGKDMLMYLYVVDTASRLLGILDTRELLLAEDETLLKDVMVENVITLSPDSTLRQAAEVFTRYGFRGLPITAEDDKILGVVLYRDIVELKHHFV